MKKLLVWSFLVILLVLTTYLWNQGLLPGVPLTDKQTIRKKTYTFYEYVKFKDFDSAANFHNEEDRKKVNIPKLLENLFKVPPEQIDIEQIDILEVDVDQEGIRGSSLTSITARILTIDKTDTKEGKLYWKKENDQWVMKLESSLSKISK